MWAWGFNGNGAIGDGTSTTRILPVQIGTALNWKTVATGFDSTYATKTDGTIWSWGYNNAGKLGIGTTDKSFVPIQIGMSNNWAMGIGGNNHGGALTLDGDIYTWGGNSASQLGDGTTTDRYSPVLVNCSESLTATTQVIALSCFNDSTGSASITSVVGGTAPYTFLWSNGKQPQLLQA